MGTAEALKKLFRYELLRDKPIGKGGCGHVWECHDLLFDRKVALKTIDENLFWDRPDESARTFRKEAAAGARLGERSRHIVKVNDFGLVEGVLYFSMEWIQPESEKAGIDISSLMGDVSLVRAKSILFQICEAVELAHREGIVHCDIAPWNIVYDATNNVYKLADFGLLKIIESRLLSHGSGSLLRGGRLAFQPPTVRQDMRRISYSTDVYALAVSLRALLEGGDFLSHGASVQPTPPVIRMRREQRDAPPQLRHLLLRFIDGHTEQDRITDFVEMLHRIPS